MNSGGIFCKIQVRKHKTRWRSERFLREMSDEWAQHGSFRQYKTLYKKTKINRSRKKINLLEFVHDKMNSPRFLYKLVKRLSKHQRAPPLIISIQTNLIYLLHKDEDELKAIKIKRIFYKRWFFLLKPLVKSTRGVSCVEIEFHSHFSLINCCDQRKLHFSFHQFYFMYVVIKLTTRESLL